MTDGVQRKSKYEPECTHVRYHMHFDQQCIEAKEKV